MPQAEIALRDDGEARRRAGALRHVDHHRAARAARVYGDRGLLGADRLDADEAAAELDAGDAVGGGAGLRHPHVPVATEGEDAAVAGRHGADLGIAEEDAGFRPLGAIHGREPVRQRVLGGVADAHRLERRAGVEVLDGRIVGEQHAWPHAGDADRGDDEVARYVRSSRRAGGKVAGEFGGERDEFVPPDLGIHLDVAGEGPLDGVGTYRRTQDLAVEPDEYPLAARRADVDAQERWSRQARHVSDRLGGDVAGAAGRRWSC